MVRYALRRATPFLVRERPNGLAARGSASGGCSYGSDELSMSTVVPVAVESAVAVDAAAPVDAPAPDERASQPEHSASPSSVDSSLDPFEDADALDDLGYEIATLAAHIHAVTQRLLVLIADFDRRRGWELDGQRSCAHWLAFRIGIDLGAAREKVRTARALSDLPETNASMARGELSFSAVRALTRIADPENEAALLDLARGCTTQQLERMVRSWRRGSRKDEAALERERHESRTFSVFPDDDGMHAVRGRLDPEVGALLMRALEAAGDALFREHTVPALQSEAARARAATQRRADAVGLLADRAMAAGFGGGCPASSEEQAAREEQPSQDNQPAQDNQCTCRAAPLERHTCRALPSAPTRRLRHTLARRRTGAQRARGWYTRFS